MLNHIEICPSGSDCPAADPFKINSNVCEYPSGADPTSVMKHDISIKNENQGCTFYFYWDENGNKGEMIFSKDQDNFTIYGQNLRYKVAPN